MFVIVCLSAAVHGGEDAYYAIDYQSGGYPYWSTSLYAANFFKTEAEALKVLKSADFKAQGPNDKFPTRMIHDATGVCYKKRIGTASIQVCAINIVPCSHPMIVYGCIREDV